MRKGEVVNIKSKIALWNVGRDNYYFAVGSKMETIKSCLREYHFDTNLLVNFDEEELPEQLKYATITQAQTRSQTEGTGNTDLINRVKAAYEWQGTPFMYIVDGSNPLGINELTVLRNTLAMRGDAPFMGVVSNGNLEIYDIKLSKQKIKELILPPEYDSSNKDSMLSQLMHYQQKRKFTKYWIVDVIQSLISESICELTKNCYIERDEAISLIFRSLLIRFLADRQLLPYELFTQIGIGVNDIGEKLQEEFPYSLRYVEIENSYYFVMPGASLLVADGEKTRFVSKWIDARFNGNILPVSDAVFSKLTTDACQSLCNILKSSLHSIGKINWKNDWYSLNFSHIPVEILVQVFESLLMEYSKSFNHKQNHFQTPEFLANLMVKVSIRSIGSQFHTSELKILDPLAGAGIFLISAFRELTAQHWLASGKRPGTEVLTSILKNRITGFELDNLSLDFAALGLCMMLIELDPEPEWSCKFELGSLRDSTLHQHDTGDVYSDFSAKHRNCYHIVVSNPLAKANYDRSVQQSVIKQVNNIPICKEISDSGINLDNRSIDLANAWFSTEWAVENGQISMILQSKWLFHQGTDMTETRMAILNGLKITSIVNCCNSTLYSRIKTPFCILFARNKSPSLDLPFRYFNSTVAKFLNNSMTFQLDASFSTLVSAGRIRSMPNKFKLLATGSIEDNSIFERLKSQNPKNLKTIWENETGRKLKRLQPSTSREAGIMEWSVEKRNVIITSSERDYYSVELEIDSTSFDLLEISKSERDLSDSRENQRQVTSEHYRGPLLVIDSNRSLNSKGLTASICDNSAFYNKGIFGYSFYKCEESRLLTRYICLILRSKIALWQLLFMCEKFSIESDNKLRKFQLDKLLIPDFTNLSGEDKKNVNFLFSRMNSGMKNGELKFEEVDNWAIDLYGLGNADLQIISDTLESKFPNKIAKKDLETAVTIEDVEGFCRNLTQLLIPFANRYELDFSSRRETEFSFFPWECINISFNNSNNIIRPNYEDYMEFWKNANSTLSDEFMFQYSNNGFVVGKLAMRRFWNQTYVELLANKVVWFCLKNFKE